MSRGRGRALSEDWEALSLQIERGKPQPNTLPTVLALKAIRLWPKVFQHRRPKDYAGKAHIAKLADAIRRSKAATLDPLTVWWDGKAWACVDGHHRHAAYVKAAVASDHSIPVQAFEGTVEEAMALAASANSRDKLAMTSAEKSNAAWRMVVVTQASKATVAKAAGVSESTVANMRRVRSQLDARGSVETDDLTLRAGVDYRDLGWPEAKRLAEGREAVDFDREAADEKKAQDMASSLLRAIGDEGRKYPFVLARALEIYDSRLEATLMDYWGARDESEDSLEQTEEF
jgi:hypothetical protein